MTQELLHCPFCGHEATGTSSNGIDSIFVFCEQCGCDGPTGKDDLEAVKAWNRRATGNQVVQGWKSIETAPRDGSQVLVFCDASDIPISGGYWYKKEKCWICGGYMRKQFPPTHWMPLPPAPGQQNEDGYETKYYY